MIAIVYSTRDPAGSGVAGYLVEALKPDKSSICRGAVTCYEGRGFILAGFSEDTIEFEFLDERLPGEAEYYIVLSRHSSAKRVKSYTVHHTGNFGPEARYGGKPRTLSIANPRASHRQLVLLRRYAELYRRIDEYDVSYEATHHGPTNLEKPLNFIEIGSSIDEWRDPVNHKVLGDTIIEYLEKGPSRGCRVVIGIGGGHYPRKHTRMALDSNYCYGHIMAKYALQYLSGETLDQMINRTYPKPVAIVVEKKGTRREHRSLIEGYVETRGDIVVEYI